MKKITLILSLFLCFGSSVYAQNKSGDKTVFGKKVTSFSQSPSGHIRCASTEYEEMLRAQDPKRATTEQFESWIAKKIEENQSMSQSGGIIYIPVVVHVIHNGDAYGTNENIKDEQVQSQITVMNQDYRRMSGTPGYNTNAVGADVQVEFVLAKVDQNGNPTNGINRVNLCRTDWNGGSSNATLALVNAEVKPVTIWDPTQYMNMWSVNFGSSGLLGYAQFPDASGLLGLNASGGAANTDGVVSGHTFFGSRTIFPGGNYGTGTKYDKGRTMTHEVGHYLGLRHIWGDDACSGTTNVATNEDFVADTPAAGEENYDCPTGTDSCPSVPLNDMIENYMDYTDDACMNIFTAGQKTRITTVMNNSPRRSTLKTSQKDVAIPLFANDAEVIIDNACGTSPATCAVPNPPSPLKTILLYNRGTSTMTSATISYNVNGGTNYVNNWTGSLAPNKYATITLANTAVNGTLNTSITSVNGGADERASNNTTSKAFGGEVFPDHAYTTFNFTLIGDPFGTETSWELTNAGGTILYSGGTYTDMAFQGTQVLENNVAWTLPTNGCYTLTVYDSYGDGIIGVNGNGSFNVKTNAGAITVISNTTFSGSSVSHSFRNTALSAESFELFDSVSLYPNPAKDKITISVPQGLDLNGKYEVYNTLGQKISTKKISSENDLLINTNNFQTGMYFINLSIGEFSKTLRFIKE